MRRLSFNRRSRWTVCLGFVAGVFAAAHTAAAQQAGDARAFISLNAGTHRSPGAFSATSPLRLNAETGELSADYGLRSALVFDVGGGVRLPANLWFGVALSQLSADHDAAISARVGHPFFFDQFRDVSGTMTGVGHHERAVHLQFLWAPPLGRRFELKVGGGPTIVKVRQDLVSKLNYTEVYPFDSATFESASMEERSQTAIGFNVGADFGVYFRPKVGAGVTARFSKASVDLDDPLGDTIKVDVGAFQIGGGLRLRF